MRWPRVLSYPPRHPYVDRLSGPVARIVHDDEDMPRLDRYYDPDWVRENAFGWDLAHLHFGHEQHPEEQVVDVLRAHERSGVPVVYTVHDLEVPHLTGGDGGAVNLLRAASAHVDSFVTLTSGAADAVRNVTGREVLVIPHGPLLGTHQRAYRRRERFLIEHPDRPWLLHAGQVRQNLDWRAVLAAYPRSSAGRPLLITVDAGHAQPIREAAADMADVTVSEHDGRMPHAWLEAALVACHGVVLPYTHGTHSGLLELAADVGVPTVATDVGYLRDQQPARFVAAPGGDIDVDDLAAALGEPAPAEPPISDASRAEDARTLTRRHANLYSILLSREHAMEDAS